MSYRAGAEIMGCDFCSHHSAGASFDTLGMNMFTALGGKFVNVEGEQFLSHYDPVYVNNTLMHRSSQAMALEVMAGRGPISLDMTRFSPEDIAKLRVVLPLITKNLEAMGIMVGDRIVEKMEWVSANFGTIGIGGGVRINTRCETTLSGLYAAGDAAITATAGVEGYAAALTFAAVSGARAGRFAAEQAKGIGKVRVDERKAEEIKGFALNSLMRKDGIEPDQVVLALQEAITSREVFIIMHGERLKKALEEVERIRDNQLPLLHAYDPHYLRMAHEAQNMVLCAEMWLRSVLERKESRGSILREDYPEVDNINWLKWITLKKVNGTCQ